MKKRWDELVDELREGEKPRGQWAINHPFQVLGLFILAIEVVILLVL